jgi:hypothetical protein
MQSSANNLILSRISSAGPAPVLHLHCSLKDSQNHIRGGTKQKDNGPNTYAVCAAKNERAAGVASAYWRAQSRPVVHACHLFYHHDVGSFGGRSLRGKK